MLDKFSSDSICGGGAGTYGTETDYSGVGGVNSLLTCQDKCKLDGRAICNNLLYKPIVGADPF